ncbi:cobalamin synthesis protein [Methylophaga lonarensis MPL]|uniref:Cobalamin synthesis protein n=1 Tax=Methylophaga lonarensis MPL TaxID=1286106 RepID=M7PQL2_9GAMM|nr:GTP-binding protein [Methylophaga lonarensis]EMR12729.1 cobalamin synthesis protein [Methylophaga lonarensis MPL]
MSNAQTNPAPAQIPVTILTGYLGSGKTTLINHILSAPHGQRIAVIENEFGEAGIDNELLVQDSDEQIIEMNNGCICCTVRGDLVRILNELSEKKADGRVKFDRVIIETTGLADPAPVAQTFFVDDDIRDQYMLDAIVTTVDAKHAQSQLDQHHEAQEQVGFADRILITKSDLVDDTALQNLQSRLRKMNSRAAMIEVNHGNTDIEEILDIRGFNLNAILEIEPHFLDDVAHDHDDHITSFVFTEKRALDPDRLEEFLTVVINTFGTQLLRYKGVLHVDGMEHRIVIQGVHMLMGSVPGAKWGAAEQRQTKFVFIGRDLPKEIILKGLETCIAE